MAVKVLSFEVSSSLPAESLEAAELLRVHLSESTFVSRLLCGQ